MWNAYKAALDCVLDEWSLGVFNRLNLVVASPIGGLEDSSIHSFGRELAQKRKAQS